MIRVCISIDEKTHEKLLEYGKANGLYYDGHINISGALKNLIEDRIYIFKNDEEEKKVDNIEDDDLDFGMDDEGEDDETK